MYFDSVLIICYFHLCFAQSVISIASKPLIQATLATERVQTDPDDPAIWIHPAQSELSLLIGTDKANSIGGLYVFNLAGQVMQHIENIDRPNNVDVEYGFQVNGTSSIDLVVLTERGKKRLRIFGINRTNSSPLYDLTGEKTSVFTESTGDEGAPMGVGLYKREVDGKFYAIVSRKTGPAQGYLGQYELIWNSGKIDLKFIRNFGAFQGNEIESIVVDDQLGFVYYSDEGYGIRKYHVDPLANITEQLGFINTTTLWQGDSEGIALYRTSDQNGYIIITDQIANGSTFHIYERQGKNSYLKSIRTLADRTDGIEVTNSFLNENFPRGLFMVMNSVGKNFLVYDWRDFAKELDNGKNYASQKQTSFIYIILELGLILCAFYI